MVIKSSFLTASIVFSAFCLAPMAAIAADVTPQEYALFMDWKDGQTDERLAEDDPETKKKKIAKNRRATISFSLRSDSCFPIRSLQHPHQISPVQVTWKGGGQRRSAEVDRDKSAEFTTVK